MEKGLIISNSNFRINEAIEFINKNFITESDEPSSTFEWDLVKDKIDGSKKYIKTKEQAYEYLLRLLDKVKNLPKSVKVKIIKYVSISLLAFLGSGTINKAVIEKAPEVSQKITTVINSVSKKVAPVVAPEVEPEVVATGMVSPNKSSDELLVSLKREEGRGGKAVLKAYNLGDGMITVGWGHAQKIKNSPLKVGDLITLEKAVELLKIDIKEAEDGLNRLFNRWEKAGINLEVNQDMYDAMISMIFNMGLNGFLSTDFIQLVKKGELEKATKKILTTKVSYPGHVPRRQRESEMFSKSLNFDNIAINEVRSIIKSVLSEMFFKEEAKRASSLPDTAALFVERDNFKYYLTIYDPKQKKAYATIGISYELDESNFQVFRVASEKGFGPFMYELAMMHIDSGGDMLMPSRDGDVRGEAFSVWEKFYTRNDVYKETVDLFSDEFKCDLLVGNQCYFDSKEEKLEWWNEWSEEDKKSLIVFNTSYSMEPNKEYYNLYNKSELYSKEIAESAYKSGEELWGIMY